MNESTVYADTFPRQLLTGGIMASVKKIFTPMILGVWDMPPGTAAFSDVTCISGSAMIGGTQSCIVGLQMGETLARELTAFMTGMAAEEAMYEYEVLDTIGELTHMIAGDVMRILQKRQGELHLSNPSVMTGRNYVVAATGSVESSLVVPFLFENGCLAVSLRMTDVSGRAESWMEP
jgi:chemotaxis protein CheX